jgi:thymidylate synthase (FAD)
MKILRPEATIRWITPNAIQMMASAARVCYQSEEVRSNLDLLKHVISRGHLSVLEQAVASVLVTTNRGVTHELVRHRLVSYLQESTRYCNYSKGRFSGEVRFCPSVGIRPQDENEMLRDLALYEQIYLKWLDKGYQPQFARQFLPIATKTEIVVTCNMKEWAYILNLRTTPAAHPDIKALMESVRSLFYEHSETKDFMPLLLEAKDENK